jgi:mono/diheme cytochrome c family protein
MKNARLVFAMIMMVGMCTLIVRAQDQASGEKTFKAKCAGCHGADAAGKAAMKSPSIKGKSVDEIQKVLSTSPKHSSLKGLTSDDVKNIAAYLATLK